eukprot:SAG31_NODE_1297_length_8934_cov_26.567176_5_plen_32_part_00
MRYGYATGTCRYILKHAQVCTVYLRSFYPKF